MNNEVSHGSRLLRKMCTTDHKAHKALQSMSMGLSISIIVYDIILVYITSYQKKELMLLFVADPIFNLIIFGVHFRTFTQGKYFFMDNILSEICIVLYRFIVGASMLTFVISETIIRGYTGIYSLLLAYSTICLVTLVFSGGIIVCVYFISLERSLTTPIGPGRQDGDGPDNIENQTVAS